MSMNLRRMTDFFLSLSNITKAVYPGFHEGQTLLQIQLIQALLWDLSDLKNLDERGTAKTLAYGEENCVCHNESGKIYVHQEKGEVHAGSWN